MTPPTSPDDCLGWLVSEMKEPHHCTHDREYNDVVLFRMNLWVKLSG